MDGAYDGVRLKCTSQAVLTDNEIEKNGNSLPLELMPSGQFEPLYKTTLSVQVVILIFTERGLDVQFNNNLMCLLIFLFYFHLVISF